jgi:ankyrin repeat protein
MAMIRHAKILFNKISLDKICLKVCLGVAAALACSTIVLQAQQAPTERDLAIYAGLHAAAASGEVAEIEKLIADGENPNIQDANSRTPLLVAAYRKHYAAVEALLKHGANANARDMQGFDVLTLAAVNNDMQLLKLALAGGADPGRVTGPLDGTALISAAHLGNVEIVRALIDAKAPLDHVNRMGWTALIIAVMLGNNSKGHIETVDLLVKAGADTEIKDRQGMTALGHARARGYQDMITILQTAAGRKT